MKITIDTNQIDEGAQAYRRGIGVGANPYLERTHNALAWLIGYMSEYFFSKEGEHYRSSLAGKTNTEVN